MVVAEQESEVEPSCIGIDAVNRPECFQGMLLAMRETSFTPDEAAYLAFVFREFHSDGMPVAAA